MGLLGRGVVLQKVTTIHYMRPRGMRPYQMDPGVPSYWRNGGGAETADPIPTLWPVQPERLSEDPERRGL